MEKKTKKKLDFWEKYAKMYNTSEAVFTDAVMVSVKGRRISR